MHKRIRWISALGAAVAAAIVGIVIITSSAAGTDDPGSRLNVFKTGTSTTPSASVIASLTQIGTDATDVQAVTVPALDGSATPWTVAQSTEGVCLVQSGEDGSTKTNCGTTAALSRGATVGFTPDEVSITAEQNVLAVEGRKAEKTEHQYLYQGISARPFRWVFNLADHVEVKGASFEGGLLKIDLVREIPEAMKPRRITINASNDNKQIEQEGAA